MVVIMVVTSKQSCVSSSGQRLLEYFKDLSGRLDASFRGRAHFACVLQMILDWFHSPRVCADDSRPTTIVSRAVLHVAASVWCYVCRCVLERNWWRMSCVLGVQTACGSSLRLLESLRRLSWAYLLQFRQLCPSSSETRCATCLSANGGGVAPLSWLVHVATA